MELAPPPDEEPTPDDLEFYYGLNRRSAQNNDSPFANWGVFALIGFLALIPLLFILSLTGIQIGLLFYLLLILFFIFPPLLIIIMLLNGLALTSLLEWLRQIFKANDK